MIDRRFDVVIVGSGAGGGTAAQQLAPLVAQGRSVAVLEWGPKLAESEYTCREADMAGKLYVAGGGFLTAQRDMTLAFARAWGGSTVVYTGTSIAIQAKTVERWGLPGLDADDLRRRCRAFMVENNVHLLPEELVNDNNRLFREGCERLGYRCEQFPLNLKGCRGSGFCNLGCPNAAKQGTLRVQLPAAEAAGVETVTNCKVERIGDHELFARVSNPPVGLPSHWEPGEYRIAAKVVVVAGGAINSPALLLRSGYGSGLPALGRYLTVQPALILVAQHDRAITNYFGHPKSYYCDQFADSDGFLLETCMYFPFTTAKNLAGFGVDHAALMSDMARLQMILVLAIDTALPANRVNVGRDGEPVVHYAFADRVLASLLASMGASARIFFAAGARRVHAPAGVRFFIERHEAGRIDELITRERLKLGTVSINSAHLMGGCRMGTDRRTSVTDVWGQVHGVPWLYVADGSLFPSAAEINPYLTIMAFADRVAQRVRERAGELLA